MHSSLKTLFAALVAIAAVGCSSPSKTGGGATANCVAETPDQVVATYNGQKITLKQVDEELAPQLQQIEEEKFKARRQKIEELVLKSLVDAEAKKANQTEDQWLKEQIESKIKDPTEEEIAAFFAQNQARMPPGTSMDQVKPQIVGMLKQQGSRDVAMKVFDDLKQKAKFELLFKEPAKPRKQVEAKGPSRGPADAKVTIIEFSDFQCPFCSRAHDTVEQVMTNYAGKVKLVFRQFPLDFHEKAPKAGEASLCAHEQGKFWEYHDLLFKNQNKLEIADLKEHAGALGLDAAKFAECLDSGKMKKTMDEDMAAGKKAGVSGTPAFFINGQLLSGAQPLEAFKTVIDEELKN